MSILGYLMITLMDALKMYNFTEICERCLIHNQWRSGRVTQDIQKTRTWNILWSRFHPSNVTEATTKKVLNAI